MRLLEAYCASGQGGGLFRRDPGERTGSWRLTEDGFCLPDEGETEALRKALERSGADCFYIPLAVDLQSGCVLFLAGKEIYKRAYHREVRQWRTSCGIMEEQLARLEEQYAAARKAGGDTRQRKALRDQKKKELEKEEKKREKAEKTVEQYEKTAENLCFDFLRLDRRQMNRAGENPAGKLRLLPVFHTQAGKPFRTVLREFLDYCKGECDRTAREVIPREAIQEFNGSLPPDLPEAFGWAVERGSRESEEAFHDSRSRPLERPGDSPNQGGRT